MKKAFALIELLVVVLIIGILAAVALPQYQKAVAKTRYGRLKPLVSAIATAEEVYFVANGKYTSEIEELDFDWPQIPSEISEDMYGDKTYIFGDEYMCSLNSAASLARVVCASKKDKNLSYGKMLAHQSAYPSYANKQRCLTSNEKLREICKAESGLSEPTGGTVGGTNAFYW